MAELTSNEVSLWKSHPITKKVMERIALIEADATEMMIQGVQSYDYARGLIAGLRVVYNVEGDEADGNKE